MTLPEDMDPVMRRLRALEKEVASLRGRNPLASATLDDEDGNRRINFGQLPSGAFGFEVFDADGHTVLVVDETQSGLVIREPTTDQVVARIGQVFLDGGAETGIAAQTSDRFVFLATAERGLVTPPPQYEWRRIQDPVGVTSGTFTSVWQSIPLFFSSDSVWVSMALQSPAAGTTGEVRLEMFPPGSGTSVVSATQSIPAGFNGYRTWRWDLRSHGIVVGNQDSTFMNVQIRRTAGTGTIWTYEPLPMLVRDHRTLGATPTGV